MPVIMVGPNGAMVHKASIAAALAGLDAAKKTMIVTTDQTVTTVTIPSTVALVVTNGAVITVGTSLTVQGEFTKPAYNCFAGAGTVTLPTTGPGVTQSFSVKDLVMGGALTGATTMAASGAVTAASFNGAHNGKIGVDVASATTTDIGASVSDYVTVTGTTTITGLGAGPVGATRVVNFSGALTLTNSATLVLPGAANILTVAGDKAEFTCTAASTWVCTNFQRGTARPFFDVSNTSTRGYVKIPGGVVIQWGIDLSETAGLTFPVAFPTACVSITGTALGDGLTTFYLITVNAPTTSGFYFHAHQNAAGASISGIPVRWIAIGY